MTIKKVPVCPFCNSDMEKAEQHIINLPTRLELLHTRSVHEPPPGITPMESARVIIDCLTYRAWTCKGCRFVAMFDGELR